MDSEEDLFGQSHSAMELRPAKTDEELDEDWWETEEDLTKTWRRLLGRPTPRWETVEQLTKTDEKLKKNCGIRKKAPAFMHLSTLAKIWFFPVYTTLKSPLWVTCLAHGKPSFLTSSSIHQEKGKHIFNLAFSWVPLRSFFSWDDSFFNFHPLLRRSIFLCT